MYSPHNHQANANIKWGLVLGMAVGEAAGIYIYARTCMQRVSERERESE
jgi:hypothetical protein